MAGRQVVAVAEGAEGDGDGEWAPDLPKVRQFKPPGESPSLAYSLVGESDLSFPSLVSLCQINPIESLGSQSPADSKTYSAVLRALSTAAFWRIRF